MYKKIAANKLLSVIFLISFLLLSVAILWASFAMRGSSGPLILHFDNISGITVIGNFVTLLLFGATGIIISVLNFFIALEFEARDWFWGKLMAAATLVLAFLIFVGFMSIIAVN